jgi:hypothetical protein
MLDMERSNLQDALQNFGPVVKAMTAVRREYYHKAHERMDTSVRINDDGVLLNAGIMAFY